MGNAISDIQLWIICVISQIDGKTSGAGDIMTRKLKSMWGTAGASFLSFSKALCVCVSVTYMFCESYLLLFVKLHKHLKAPACQSWSHYRLCDPPCPHYISSGIHTVCAWSDWEWSMQSRLSRGPTARIFEWLPLRMLRSRGENSLWGGSFHQRSSRYQPRFRRGGAVAVLVRITDGSDGRNEDGRAPIFFLSLQIQRPLSEIGSPPCGSSPRRKGSMLRLSFSEERDREDVDELSQKVMFALAYCEWI